jgi:autotransporter-associated beta strand protein
MTGGEIGYELVGGLIKNGAGTLNLGTILNFYRGTTVVNEGAIIVTRTTAGVTATATLTPTSLTVDFGGATPKLGTVFKFFPGATQAGITVTLTNVGGGVVGSYNPASSSLSIGVTPDTTGLAAWFDATADGSLYSAATGGTSVTANGAAVVRWEDISGNGAHLFNEHAVDRHPALTLNSINNKKGIRFNGDYLGRQNNNRWLRKQAPNSVFYYIVLKHNTLAQPGNGTTRIMNSTHYPAASGGSAQSFFFGSNTTEIRMRLNSVTCNVARPIDLAPFLVEFGRNASDGAKLYINGVDQNVYTGPFTPVPGTHVNESAFFGGGGITTTETLIGDICEILIYNATPSESERQAIETYLRNKWAIY